MTRATCVSSGVDAVVQELTRVTSVRLPTSRPPSSTGSWEIPCSSIRRTASTAALR